MRVVICVVVLFAMTGELAAQEMQTIWRCLNPAKPSRFATSEEFKKQPPACNDWLQLRGPNLRKIIEALAGDAFEAANIFLADAADAGGFKYPTETGAAPVSTATLFRSPEAYGFSTTPLDGAPVGSLVLYDGLGGILVEARASDSDTWTQKVLYPSAQSNFRLVVGDVSIPGKAKPKVLVIKDQHP